MGRLDGRVALVTGAARGLGHAFARALAGEGARVAIASRSDGAAAAAGFGGRHFPLDISDAGSVAVCVDAVRSAFGTIDVLVNNAAHYAGLREARYDEIEPDLWDRVMAVNVRGTFLMVRAVAPLMEANGGGRIINVTSGTVYKGMPGMLHYVASKGAVTAMTRTLSRELGARGICVNSLAPGLTLTEAHDADSEHVRKYGERILASRAIRRHAHPEDLTGALVFLASEESRFVTGQTIVVDGGSVNT